MTRTANPETATSAHKFTSPDFRHSVPFAKELMPLDDLSGGRITVEAGAVANVDVTAA